MTKSKPTHRMRVGFSILTVLITAVLLAACGDEEPEETTTTQTTTITSAESAAQAEAEGASTTTPLSTTPSTEAEASSDAAAAIPGGDFVVQDATAETATTPTAPTTATEFDPVTGEPVAGSTSATGTTTTEIDPATGLPATTATTPSGPVTDDGLIGADPVLAGSEAVLTRPFSADSPWNTAAAGTPIDRRSDRWIEESQIRVAQVQQENGEFVEKERRLRAGLVINTTKWTVPVFGDTQEGAVERIAICRQFDCGEDAVTSVVIPLDACPDPRYDGWMTVVDSTTRTAYDFWRARCEADGSISYHYVKRWELDGPGFQEELGVSARGSGLPLFAGLITPEEIRDGRIDHALAIAVPGAATRRYVRPASRTNGTGRRTSLPEGARIVLKKKAERKLTDRLVRNKVQRRTARIIIEALQRYGAIVVDRSKTPTMFAQRNANWTNILPLNLLQDLRLEQFRAVQAGEIFFDPPRGGEDTFDSGSDVGSPPVTSSGSQGAVEFGDPGIDLGEVLP